MYTKRQLSILALILGTIGLCLFLLEKMDIVKTKVVNYIGKALIAVGIYLLAIANIITDEGLTLLSETDGNLSLVDTSGLSGQIKTTSTAADSISTAGGINAGPITADTLKINSNVGFFGTNPVGQQNLLNLDENKDEFSKNNKSWEDPSGYEYITIAKNHAGNADQTNRNFWVVASKIENIENALINYGLLKK